MAKSKQRMTYCKLFFDYLDAIELLGDAERGRLFTALLEYGRTGEAPQLGGNERFIFPMMKAQIDRDSEQYETDSDNLSKARSEAGKKGAEAKLSKRKQTQANGSKTSKSKQTLANEAEDKDKDKDKDKEGNPPLSPLVPAEALAFPDSPELQEAFDDWLAYKRERREEYKPTGLKSLVSEIRNNADRYGSKAVADLIRECMASNWQGIIFEKLKENRKKKGGWSFDDFG